MLVGHYAVSLGLKRVEPKASLGLLFLAVQLADILFFILLPLGIERASIVPNITQAPHFRLDFAPISHGLLGSLVYSAIVYVVFRSLPAREGINRNILALAMAGASLSHWVLDVVVHPPDMALIDGGLPKVGLGLWNTWLGTYVVEAALLLGGLWWYMMATKGETFLGKYGMVFYVALMMLFNLYNLTQPPPDPTGSLAALAIPALALYAIFAAIAFWLDRKRQPAT